MEPLEQRVQELERNLAALQAAQARRIRCYSLAILLFFFGGALFASRAGLAEGTSTGNILQAPVRVVDRSGKTLLEFGDDPQASRFRVLDPEGPPPWSSVSVQVVPEVWSFGMTTKRTA